MCKKPYFLIIFVLVLGFSSAGWADGIDVNNPSFELDNDGNRVLGHAGLGIGWKENADDAAGYVGVDVQCPYAGGATPTHCHRWPGPTETGSGTDVVYCYLAQSGANAYQVLDTNTSGDPNAVIAAGRRYTLTFDAILEDPEDDGNPIKGSLFHPDNVINPDANHIELASETYAVQWILRDLGDCDGESDLDSEDHCPDWNYDLTVKFVVLEGASSIGKTLGVKLTAPTLAQEAYAFVDNVRLDWSYATIAYDPNPADGAELITKNPQLSWKPGVWADQHEVYFGTDETAVANADNTDTTGIYKTTQDPCSYTPSGPLVLGETYYWKITEVNSGYSGPAAGPPWEGDVWSFRVEGHAHSPSPADGETDVVFLGLSLEWSAGAEAENHVVYFGTDETAVANADTTDTTGIYKTTLTVGTESYAVGQLTAGETYYWRIDEKSGGGSHIITGDVWNFTAGTFLIVDDFESYNNQTDLWNVWDDYWVNGSDGEIWQENDVNIIRESGSQAAKLEFENVAHGGSGIYGSWFDVQDLTELDIGSDWTTGGVKALFLYVRGDPCNAQVVYDDGKGNIQWEGAAPWIELEDTSSNVGYVVHPNPSLMGIDYWYEWNVDLNIFDACGVTLSAIDRFTIGIGGDTKAGQSKAMSGPGYIWVDDIRVYPPRCLPEVTGIDNIHALGDFTEDCNTNYLDLELMAVDWMKIDGDVSTENRPATLSDFVGDPNWTDGYIGGALEVNNTDGQDRIDVTDPRLNGITNMTITGWVKRYGDQDGYCSLVASREAPGGATELMCDGGKDNQASYGWNGDYWGYKTSLTIPDQTWTFIAVAIEPTQATVYMHPDGGVMSSSTNVAEHAALVHFVTNFRIGRSNPDGKRFEGLIDDVRIYDWTLTEPNMEMLVHGTGEPNAWPVYWYKFDETEGLVAADSGFGTKVYSVNTSPANVVPKDPCDSEDPNLATGAFDPNNMDIINFLDYEIMAEHWLERHPWP